MPGRPIYSEQQAIRQGYDGHSFTRRRKVLRETIAAFQQADPPDHFHQLAAANLKRWKENSAGTEQQSIVKICSGDWGDVTLEFTRKYGACFAVLNMANAYVPGGGYVEGLPAQEENMYRRTDCHFRIEEDTFDPDLDRYHPWMTSLLNAQDGKVYLDAEHPRVCIRGSEDRSAPDLGYRWLKEDEIFPFYELRASAKDLRDGSDFDHQDARRRISAQLDTLKDKGIRHAILGAFGCGAFMNPSVEVAGIYREMIEARLSDFSVIAFAIYHAGYGPGNYVPFKIVFGSK